MMTDLSSHLDSLHRCMAESCRKAGRSTESLCLLAVSKPHSLSKILEALEAGQRDFGENYVQEWKKKQAQLEAENPEKAAQIRWHFIGHLQSNKVQEVVGQVEYIHSVDSLKLAKKISERAQSLGLVQKALLEVKLASEENKSGWLPLDLIEALPQLAALPAIAWQGLMTIPPPCENVEQVRPYFASLKSLLDECNQSGFFKETMNELSMGMSEDFEVAIEAGATMIRIGRAIFGARE